MDDSFDYHQPSSTIMCRWTRALDSFQSSPFHQPSWSKLSPYTICCLTLVALIQQAEKMYIFCLFQLLKKGMEKYGTCWNKLSEVVPGRSGPQCRERSVDVLCKTLVLSFEVVLFFRKFW